MEIVFATHNSNKLRELQQIVPKHIRLLSLDDIGCHEEIVEDGNSIEENALIKAKYIYDNYKMTCFGDDTGLCVDALNAAPGIYSARYAGPQKDSEQNIIKLLAKLKNTTNRKAEFKTVIAYKSKDHQKCFTGICKGKILKKCKGKKGFGYDPVFQPENCNESFAEMTADAKNKISHRGLAVKQLIEFLQQL